MMIDTSDPAAVRAEAERRARLRAKGATSFDGLVEMAVEIVDAEPGRVIEPIEHSLSEKQIEHECDKLVLKAGGHVIRFSHPGKTKQTPGIADRLYCFPSSAQAFWFEVKTPTGKQRLGQQVFEDTVSACGMAYACGGIGDLRRLLATAIGIRLE